MLNANAVAWIQALRSGKFKQTRGRLHEAKGNRYCCLGVACRVYEQQTGNKLDKKVVTSTDAKHVIKQTVIDGNSMGLPVIVREWLGLHDSDGSYGRCNDREFPSKSLVILNDTQKLDFKAIAAVIEAEPEGLFNEPAIVPITGA